VGSLGLLLSVIVLPDWLKLYVGTFFVLCFAYCSIRFLFAKNNPAMEAAGGSAVQTVSAKDTGDVTTAADNSSAFKVSGDVNAPVAGRDNIIFQGPLPESKPPHVHPRLRIDSLANRGWIRIRFELTNGDVAVTNIRKTSKSLTNSSVELSPVAGSMAPGAEISTYYEHISRTKTDDDLVILTLYFDAQLGSEVKHFISQHRFPICKEDLLAGKEIKPARNDYHEREPPPYDINEAWVKPLSRLRGYLGFGQPETLPGKVPVIIVCNVPNKLFIYDAVKRRVTFRITAPSGRVVNLQLPLKPTNLGYHDINLGFHDIYIDWRPTGGKLRVNGKEISEYDE
jgi:hypothetical protein